MADTSLATKYDLIQKERVCDDIWLCTTNPDEKCYKPCRIHNPQACDGAGLPGVDWDDDDVFESPESPSLSSESDQSEDKMTDTSFSDTEVWDSDVDTIEDSTPRTPEQQQVNSEMNKWMEVADMFYSQEGAPSMSASYGVMPPPTNGHFPGYFPWNAIYPSAGGHGGYAYPMMPLSFPFPGAIPNTFVPTTQQDLDNVNNMLVDNPWAFMNRHHEHSAPAHIQQQHQGDSSRGWDELVDEQERYQEEMAAAMVAQCVGATEECETSTDPSYIASTPAPRFASPPQPQNSFHSTEFWRQTQMMQQMNQFCS